jgi:hypothetical protein
MSSPSEPPSVPVKWHCSLTRRLQLKGLPLLLQFLPQVSVRVQFILEPSDSQKRPDFIVIVIEPVQQLLYDSNLCRFNASQSVEPWFGKKKKLLKASHRKNRRVMTCTTYQIVQQATGIDV